MEKCVKLLPIIFEDIFANEDESISTGSNDVAEIISNNYNGILIADLDYEEFTCTWTNHLDPMD